MKKLLSIILALTMCLSVMTFTVSVADTLDDFELPKPQVGYLHIHHSGVDTWDDEIDAYAFIDQSVLDLILESQEDNFYEKYGMTSDAYKTFDIYTLFFLFIMPIISISESFYLQQTATK